MYEIENPFEVWVVATRPSVEKIVDDRFYFSKKEAQTKCFKLNRDYSSTLRLDKIEDPYKVYRAFISIDRGEE